MQQTLPAPPHKIRRRILWSIAALGLAALSTAALAWPLGSRDAADPWHAKVVAAGYATKTAQFNQVTLSYAEGPDNGPPLVLLHAQMLDWFSYSRVLPELARHFHVYDIDYPGHGQTRVPADYPMTANRIGADLSDFITRNIRGPVFISGNSSGGLLAVWLAANRPALIRAALLEDPPLFASEYPRIRQTIADRAFKTSDTAATRDHPQDFLLYWVHENAQFFRNRAGPAAPFLLTQAIKAARRRNPGQPVEIGMVKNDTVRMLVRGLDQYDPRFGAAFYDGSWNKGFDHAEALTRITCPVLLMQANYTVESDGRLNGAMSREEAERAMALLKHGTFLRVDAGHVVHLDKPDLFIQQAEELFLRH